MTQVEDVVVVDEPEGDEVTLSPEAQAELEKLAAKREQGEAADPDVPAELADLTPETVSAAPTKTSKGKARTPFQTVKEKMRAKAGKKTQSETAKEKAAARKEAEKKKREERAAKEKERKATLETARKAKSAERASKKTPDFLRKESKNVQEAAAQAFKDSKLRRPKASREDFLAGWYTLFVEYRRQQRAAGKSKATGDAEPASDAGE